VSKRTKQRGNFYRTILLAAGCVAATASAAAQQPVFEDTLMPKPAHLTLSSGQLLLSPSFTLVLQDEKNSLLRSASLRFLKRLEAKTGVPVSHNLGTGSAASLHIEVQDQSASRPKMGVDESYALHIAPDGIRLQAKTTFGAMDGLETLFQVLQVQGEQFVFPAMDITDEPRFPWRGLLLDPGRHFLSVDQILRTLDGMAAVKLNVLHWHLTEDQGFRIESRRFPLLQEKGSEGLYYTQEQVRQIVQYASERGIRVVPEFDVPGHTTSWMVAYPKLGSRPGPYELPYTYGVKDSAMDPTRESTYEFLDAFVAEMATLFPDEYIHIGGDENNGKEWLGNPQIVRFMREHKLADKGALQAYFNHRMQKILEKHGRQMVGWDEILAPDLSPEVVIQNWHGTEFLINGARQGHRGLLSRAFYLDHNYSAAEMYSADPLPPDSGLTPDQQKLILGGEACMWGEQATDLTADSRIWPRSATVAERLWSPAETRDIADMYRRLAVESLRLDAVGTTHISTPEKGLRQLAGSEHGMTSLALFTSVLQPVDFHERAKEQRTSERTPIGRLVDFARPDPPARYQLSALVQAYLTAKSSDEKSALADKLKKTFQSWIVASRDVDAMAEHSPLIAEVSVRRKQFPQLAALGMQSLDLIASGTKAQPEWASAQQNLLTNAAQHTELVDFVILDALNDLLHASL
jgi:hexosaminidase